MEERSASEQGINYLNLLNFLLRINQENTTFGAT